MIGPTSDQTITSTTCIVTTKMKHLRLLKYFNFCEKGILKVRFFCQMLASQNLFCLPIQGRVSQICRKWFFLSLQLLFNNSGPVKHQNLYPHESYKKVSRKSHQELVLNPSLWLNCISNYLSDPNFTNFNLDDTNSLNCIK